MATDQEQYQKLQADRIRDSKQQMSRTAGQAGGREGGKAQRDARRRSKAGQALDMKREAELAKELPFAFTAIDPAEDFVHWLIIGFSVAADVLTFVPAIGSVIALPFIGLVWFFYLLEGHFKKSPVRKIGTTGFFQFFELLFSTLPALTASALVNYWFALADKKLTAKEEKKRQQEINF